MQTANQTMPRLPLFTAFALVASALVIVGGARIAGVSPEQSLPAAKVIESRMLRFEDAKGGRLNVIDAETGKVILKAEAGDSGFLRGALRGLNRMRMTGEVNAATPYRLEKLDNSQVILTDVGSGVKLDLNAYGRSNAATFAEFLTMTGDKS